MTDETNKLRALVLTALMVFSVFAGTVALSGAAAANASSLSNGVAKDAPVDSTGVSHEVAFDVTIDGNQQDTVTINYNAISAVTPTAVSATSSAPSDVSITGTSINNGNATVDIKDVTGDGTHTVTVVVDTTVDVADVSTGSATLEMESDSGLSTSATVDLVSSVSNGYDEVIKPGKRTWAGQTLYNGSFDYNDQGVELQRQTSNGWQFETVVDVNSFGEAFITGTSNYQTGTYRLVDTQTAGSDDDNETVRFKISQQSYSASADPVTVKNAGSGTNTDITVSSNRGNYQHWISSPDVDPSTIQSLLDGAGTLADVDGDGENEYLAIAGTTTDTLTANFTGVSAGNYTLNFVVPDTGVTASTDVTVEKAASGNAAFVTKAISEQRGDVVAINVSLSGTADSAMVQVGGPSVNYDETVQVTDENGDGYVEFYWNSYYAGTGGNTFSTAASSDDTAVRQGGLSSFSPGQLAGGEYPVNVTVNGQETDVATVVLNSPTDVSNSIQTWTAPATASNDPTASDYVLNQVTEDSSVAKGDWLVVEMQTAGVFGQLGSPPAALKTSGFADFANGANFTIVQTAASTPTNTPRRTVDTSTSDTTALLSPSGNTVFVYIDTDAYSEFEVNSKTPTQVWAATLSYQEAFAEYRSADSRTSTTFSLVGRTANIDAPQDDTETPLVVTQSDAAEVSGTSSLAAGSNLTITARSSGGQNPFLRTATATVQSDGTWSTTLDVADIPTGTNFTVSVKDGSSTKDTVNARIGGAASLQLASLDAPETAAPGSTITVTATVENTGDSSGETEVAYMFNGTTEATQNVSVDAGSTTQVTFEYTVPSTTGDYTHGVMVGDNAAVTAGITVQEESTTTTEPTTTEPTTTEPTTTEPTTTEPTTTEPTEEPTTTMGGGDDETTTGDSSGGSPGFGVAVALVALVAAALLATRRDN